MSALVFVYSILVESPMTQLTLVKTSVLTASECYSVYVYVYVRVNQRARELMMQYIAFSIELAQSKLREFKREEKTG